MIAEANQNARRSAEQFARDSGAAVGRIKTASQGYFSVGARDGEECDDCGSSGGSSPFQKVRVVTTIDYDSASWSFTVGAAPGSIRKRFPRRLADRPVGVAPARPRPVVARLDRRRRRMGDMAGLEQDRRVGRRQGQRLADRRLGGLASSSRIASAAEKYQ